MSFLRVPAYLSVVSESLHTALLVVQLCSVAFTKTRDIYVNVYKNTNRPIYDGLIFFVFVYGLVGLLTTERYVSIIYPVQ